MSANIKRKYAKYSSETIIIYGTCVSESRCSARTKTVVLRRRSGWAIARAELVIAEAVLARRRSGLAIARAVRMNCKADIAEPDAENMKS